MTMLKKRDLKVQDSCVSEWQLRHFVKIHATLHSVWLKEAFYVSNKRELTQLTDLTIQNSAREKIY
jgi:hypothetical protein